jgi:hypothetical protein
MESRKRYLAHLLMTLLSADEYATMTQKRIRFNSLNVRINFRKKLPIGLEKRLFLACLICSRSPLNAQA